jgi:hypothetical protein
MLERGALRCRFCNADARSATQLGAGRAGPIAPRPRPAGAAPPGTRIGCAGERRELEELLALSRELFLGP